MIRHLFLPGLLGPIAGLEHRHLPSLPGLETLLTRADRAAEPAGFAKALFALFGIETPADADLPTAAVSLLADSGEIPAGFVLHADPLHLLPDRDHVLAFDLDDDPLDDAEIARLVAVFNGHYDADGLRLCGSPAGRLYLHCERAASIRTHSLSAVIGRNLDPFLPDGADRRWWCGLLNETQMLCHSLSFNQQREAGGRPTLAGLWFSGGGRLPPLAKAPIARLDGDCVLARGLLALQAGEGGDELVVELGFRKAVQRADPTTWLRAVGELDRRVAGMLDGADELQLHPCDGTVYRWHVRAARRWWRRKRPLFGYLAVNPGRAVR